MKHQMISIIVIGALSALSRVVCASEYMVYSATNRADGNTIAAFKFDVNGDFSYVKEYETGGKGTGNLEVPALEYDETHPLMDGVDPLISAYGVQVSPDGKHLFVVNAGDATISCLNIKEDGSLALCCKEAAGDKFPVSIAVSQDLIYVASIGTEANGGVGSGNLTGYRFDAESATLVPLEGATRDLGARPACAMFSSDGSQLVVVELATGNLKSYSVASTTGLLSSEPTSVVSSPAGDESRWLPIPVGFTIVEGEKEDIILVSEARFLDKKGQLREEADVVPMSPKYSWQTGSTSSYLLSPAGKISPVSADVLTGKSVEGGQIANCWVVASEDGKYLWTANALSSSISCYGIDTADGSLVLKHEKAFSENEQMSFFSDLYLAPDKKHIVQLVGNKGSILLLKIGEDGALAKVGYAKGMPEVGSYGVVTVPLK